MKLDWKTIQESIKQIIWEYNFDPHQVLDIVKLWIKTAFKKDYLSNDKKYNLHIVIAKDWQIKIYKELLVVEEEWNIKDKDKEILFEDAKNYKSDIEVWENLYLDITPDNLEFSRISVQSAAQTIKQNMRKIERERFFQKFQDKEWDLLKAKVIKIINDNIVLDMDWTTVILLPEWQIPNKIYSLWEEVLVLLKQISKSQGEIFLDIVQSGPEYIEAILYKNIPELSDWTVFIEKIERSSGNKTKVLVYSDDQNVDAVWVFMWQSWDRIHTILSILDWEKIEFIQDSDKDEILVKNSLKPARINHVEIKNWVAYVTLNKDQKAIAIWKQAINIKLASRLTWYKIQINE